MNAITIGTHVINLDALAWANLDFQWKKDVPQYEYDRCGLATTTGIKRETHTGILLTFVGGSTLTFEDGTPGAKHLRAAITYTLDAPPPALDEAYNPQESAILCDLPADLRTAILATQGG